MTAESSHQGAHPVQPNPVGIQAGFWAAAVAVATVLAVLPWWWWHGGTLEWSVDPADISHVDGFAYSIPEVSPVQHSFRRWIWVSGETPRSFFFEIGSGAEDERLSTFGLYEDGQLLGPSNTPVREIARLGGGRFAPLASRLFFSSSDNSDPRVNGRQYTIQGFSKPRLAPAPLIVGGGLWLTAAVFLGIAISCRQQVIEFFAPAWTGGALTSLLLLGLFSIYAFAFAIPYLRRVSVGVLICLAVVAALSLWIRRRPVLLRGWMLWPAAFLLYGVGRAHLVDGSQAAWPTYEGLVLGALAGLLIYSAMYGVGARPVAVAYLLAASCLSYAVALLLQNHGFDILILADPLDESRRPPLQYGPWTQKYQETWLLFWTWGAVAALVRWRHRLAPGLLLTVSGLVCLSGYSYSARAAFVLGLIVFLAALWRPRPVTIGTALAASVLFLAMPVLANGLWSSYLERPELLGSRTDLGPHVVPRLVVWEYASQLTGEHPWLGRGLGVAPSLPGARADDTAAAFLRGGSGLPPELAGLRPLPGGHPHSLPLLIWLETGVVGVGLAIGCLLSLWRRLTALPDVRQRAALLALTTTFLFIFGCNYPAWHPTLLMVIAMTLGLVGTLSPGTSSTPRLDEPRS